MPLELGLELMPVVGTDGLNSEEEFLYNVVNKINRTGLIVLLIDFLKLRYAYSHRWRCIESV